MNINDALGRGLNFINNEALNINLHDKLLCKSLLEAMKEPEEVPQPDKDMFGEPPLEVEKKEEEICENCNHSSKTLSNYPEKLLCMLHRKHVYKNIGCIDFIIKEKLYTQPEIEEKLKPLIDYVKIWPPFASNGDTAIEQTLKNFGINPR